MSDYKELLRFNRLDEAREPLKKAWSVVEPRLPQVLDRFYAHVTTVPALAVRLEGHLDRLKRLQREHWTRLFQGNFDEDYRQGVYRIGQVHCRIGLEPRWFLGGYQFLLGELASLMVGRRAGRQAEVPLRAVIAAVKFDVAQVMEAYLDAVEAKRRDQLKAVSQEMARQILEGLRSFQGSVLDQSAGVVETAATAEQIVRNLDRLNQLIDEQAANITQTSASVEEVMANIGSVNSIVGQMDQSFVVMHSATQDGLAKIRAVVDAIGHLVDEARHLRQANEAIESIADQTNLLALNAAIEAAHAGKAGAGFAVVSGEIRKLSNQAGTQSHEIHQNIQAMDGSIEGSHQVADEALQSFERILSEYRGLEERSQKIVDSMHEQTEGSRQILEATAGMNHITAEVRNQSRQMLEGGRAIHDEMQKVLHASEDMRRRTDDLISQVEAIGDTVVRAYTG